MAFPQFLASCNSLRRPVHNSRHSDSDTFIILSSREMIYCVEAERFDSVVTTWVNILIYRFLQCYKSWSLAKRYSVHIDVKETTTTTSRVDCYKYSFFPEVR